jgi:hypothetical protein
LCTAKAQYNKETLKVYLHVETSYQSAAILKKIPQIFQVTVFSISLIYLGRILIDEPWRGCS